MTNWLSIRNITYSAPKKARKGCFYPIAELPPPRPLFSRELSSLLPEQSLCGLGFCFLAFHNKWASTTEIYQKRLLLNMPAPVEISFSVSTTRYDSP